MSFRFNCPECGQATKFKDESAGKKATCRECGTKFTLPANIGPPQKPAKSDRESDKSDPVNEGNLDLDLLAQAEREASVFRPAPSPKKAKKKKEPKEPEVTWITILKTPIDGELWGKALIVTLISIGWSMANAIGFIVCVFPGLIGMIYHMGWLFTRMSEVCADAAGGDIQPEENSVGTVVLVGLLAAGPLVLTGFIADIAVGIAMKTETPALVTGAVIASAGLALAATTWFAVYIPMSIATHATTGSVSLGTTWRYFTLSFSDPRWRGDLILWWLYNGVVNVVFFGVVLLIPIFTGVLASVGASRELFGSLSVLSILGVMTLCYITAMTILVMTNFINVQTLGHILRRNRDALGYGSRRTRDHAQTIAIPTPADVDL